ncbi:TlpA family protein disulfide reductase [Mariniflexile aquimaris]|uniref:TlpA family protein disulfide reductase n=1 Tax=Mariniflexile aquimaris TaxID=881009 RepID=A0ABW3BTL2_9FLAO
MRFKILVLALVLMGCNNSKKTDVVNVTEEVESSGDISKSDDLEVYDFAGFEKFLNQNDNKIHVINFWATWCAPCVKELPYFERLNTEYGSKNVDVLLVSLDFPHLYDSKLKPFIKKKNIRSKVIALDDVDMNTWIPKVDETWSGSLPATIIYKNKERKFFEKSFTFEELETEVKQFLK